MGNKLKLFLHRAISLFRTSSSLALFPISFLYLSYIFLISFLYLSYIYQISFLYSIFPISFLYLSISFLYLSYKFPISFLYLYFIFHISFLYLFFAFSSCQTLSFFHLPLFRSSSSYSIALSFFLFLLSLGTCCRSPLSYLVISLFISV